MSIEKALMQRSDNKCELCGHQDDLSVFAVPPQNNDPIEEAIVVCSTCQMQMTDLTAIDVNHWRCLNDSMWSPVPAVQVMAYRQLHQLSIIGESWAQDLLEMLYLDEQHLEWAKSGIDYEDEDAVIQKDCHGMTIEAGDTVILTKDLDVKGAGFTAKRGTAVRNIGVTNNPEHIEGRVNGQRIVIITKFVKKQ